MTHPSTHTLETVGGDAAPMPTGLNAPGLQGLTGVTEMLTAKHRDLILDEGLHGHTWAVTAFYPAKPFRDGRALKASLRVLLDALPGADGILPPELWAAEDIAKRVLLLANCVGARVVRSEGFEAWAFTESLVPAHPVAASGGWRPIAEAPAEVGTKI